MGHKVHPTGIRLGISKDWNSKWYANKKQYAGFLAADLRVREMLRKRLAQAGISKILIERPANNARVTIHTARPGVVIGKRGEDIEKLRKDVSDLMGVPAHINVTEVRKPELDAQLVAESIAQQLERRIMFRRAMKRAVGNAMRLGALGIKVNVAGRLNGAEIARSEWYREGRVPLHTLRADVDYGFAEAKTTYGIIGIKVWIYKGDILPYKVSSEEKITREAAMAAGETSGQAKPQQRRVISAGGGRRKAADAEEVTEEAKPIIDAVDPEIERMLAEEEDIERRTSSTHHEAPHFQKDSD
jgi:small subunit ribosomal protein S3